MRHYIANNGAEVVAVSSLALSAGSNIIAVKDATVSEIIKRFGRERIERLLQEHNVSGTVEALTESEARAILRFKSFDSLRDKLSQDEGEVFLQDDAGSQSQSSVRGLTSRVDTGSPKFKEWFSKSKILDDGVGMPDFTLDEIIEG